MSSLSIDLDATLAGLDDLLDLTSVTQPSLETELLEEEARLLADIEAEQASLNLKALVAKNKAAAEERKKKEDDLKMQQYMLEESQAIEAEQKMKERIARTRREHGENLLPKKLEKKRKK